ncbi:MAG: hypothetical protein Ct9H90mP13_08290 [Pseudomonadota bacterium]|nr:MAG: hypothetical protein Ct9H90mP13_08290 [Pseudomonadota bacterium]
MQRISKQNPTNTYAMSLLSDIADRLGYFDDAEFLLESAVKFEPNDGELRMKYAMILRKKQKFAETMKQVNILCDQFPENLSYQAQKASEIMQNGDHMGQLIYSMKSFIRILITSVFSPPRAMHKKHWEKQSEQSRVTKLHIKSSKIMAKLFFHWQT